MVDALKIGPHLGTEPSLRHGMILIGVEADRAPVLHLDERAAGVGAIVCARAAHNLDLTRGYGGFYWGGTNGGHRMHSSQGRDFYPVHPTVPDWLQTRITTRPQPPGHYPPPPRQRGCAYLAVPGSFGRTGAEAPLRYSATYSRKFQVRRKSPA